jgi:putative addiction module component (TIGR02574 family)
MKMTIKMEVLFGVRAGTFVFALCKVLQRATLGNKGHPRRDMIFEKLWYHIFMTKLQSIVAEIKALPLKERQELVSLVANLATAEDDFFELTDTELAELDRRILNVGKEPTVSSEDVFTALRERYVQSNLA